ncbi:hypothetical protein DTL42_13255 [Bremerella cremea]|uniref:Uncharacterized protein n=1 Tax=Bremerella cremea TaxID=1031537 RepID=A0A368KRR1_9BACT|nr:hypothetical protein DTL42_13255 [Bremerella cremea]
MHDSVSALLGIAVVEARKANIAFHTKKLVRRLIAKWLACLQVVDIKPGIFWIIIIGIRVVSLPVVSMPRVVNIHFRRSLFRGPR